MKLRLAIATGLCVLGGVSTARAQTQGAAREEVTIGYQGLPYKASGENNTGIQVSDGVLLHVGAGVETGYDTNLFYQESNPVGSPLLRSTFFADLSNATRTGQSGKVSFNLRAGLGYRRYQSDNPAVQPFSNAWMPTAGASLGTGSGQFGFGVADTFARLEDPPYAGRLGGVGAPITRYNNQASVEGRWSPGGGRLTATLRYTNMIDVYAAEAGYSYANSDTNYLLLDTAWKWLPKTAVFLSARQGYVFYLDDTATGSTAKASSFPLLVTTGLRGLLTEKTSAVVALGYMNGFYSSGPSTGGFLGSSFAELSLTIMPTMLSRIVVGARHDFTNAVVSSFSYNESIYASYVQQIAGRLALDLSGRYVHRDYQGQFVDLMQVGRKDDFIQVGAGLDYFVRNWIYTGVAYSLLLNSSNFSTNDYVKQQVFVRLGVTY